MAEAKREANAPMVYLASKSPRRAAILDELGISYRVLAADADEIVADGPGETVEENAARKLIAGLAIAAPGAVVVAADTVLEVQGRLLGKPTNRTMAREYLQTLSGRLVTAWSAVGIGVAGEANGRLATETAEVQFRSLQAEVIDWYLSTGEPMGRAGAFGIGQIGEVLTASVDGCYSCISGLPKTVLLMALASVAGDRLPQWLRNVPTSLANARVRLRPLPLAPRDTD